MNENELYEEIVRPIKELNKIVKENNEIIEELAQLKEVLPKKVFNKISKPVFKQLLKRLKNR